RRRHTRLVSDWSSDVCSSDLIDATAVVLTLGVEAQTRIVPVETKPECPFPSTLETVAHVDEGRINLAVPIDVPFAEVNRLIEAKIGRASCRERGEMVEVWGVL